MSFAVYPSLRERVVLITGGGSGIGAAMVEAFVAQGARVAFIDILKAQSETLAERVSALGPKPLFLPCDLTAIPALEAAIATVRERLGPIGALVNNAANDTRQPSSEVTEADWDRTMALNLKHQFFAARTVHAHMRELGGGSIVNFSSVAWMEATPRLTPYGTAKAAIVGMTNMMAREFGPDNVRVNAIAPGAVSTERQRRLWISPEDLERVVARQCLHRVLYAEDVARLALFLASDDSAMITKQCLIIDAGLY